MPRDLAAPGAFDLGQRRAVQDLSRRIEELPKGIVGKFPLASSPQSVGTSYVALTGNLKFTLLRGRIYRIRCYVRAVTTAAANANMGLFDGTTDLHATFGGYFHFYVPASATYQQALGEVTVEGDGQTYDALNWRGVATATSNWYVDNSGSNGRVIWPATIEDLGTV